MTKEELQLFANDFGYDYDEQPQVRVVEVPLLYNVELPIQARTINRDEGVVVVVATLTPHGAYATERSAPGPDGASREYIRRLQSFGIGWPRGSSQAVILTCRMKLLGCLARYGTRPVLVD